MINRGHLRIFVEFLDLCMCVRHRGMNDLRTNYHVPSLYLITHRYRSTSGDIPDLTDHTLHHRHYRRIPYSKRHLLVASHLSFSAYSLSQQQERQLCAKSHPQKEGDTCSKLTPACSSFDDERTPKFTYTSPAVPAPFRRISRKLHDLSVANLPRHPCCRRYAHRAARPPSLTHRPQKRRRRRCLGCYSQLHHRW